MFPQKYSHLFQVLCYCYGGVHATNVTTCSIQLCYNKWCFPPGYITPLTVLLLKEVKPKSFDDLKIIEVAD